MVATVRSRRLTRRLAMLGPAVLVAVLSALTFTLGLAVFGPSAAGADEPIAVSITDDVISAHPGQVLTYQSTVVNSSPKDVSLLLEITIPGGAKVDDAGGGTIRQSLIDYGLTVSANAQASERFVITLGPASGQSQVDTVASVHLLGAAATANSTSSTSAVANLQSTDSDALVASAAAANAGTAPSSAAVGGAATAATTRPAHRGWWIAALVVGALLVLIGLWLAVHPGGSGGRRRRNRRSVPAANRPIAATAIATAAIRTGSHQARRSAG